MSGAGIRHRSMRTRIAAGMVALALGVLVLAPKPQETEATWSDPEVAAGTFTALTVPTPLYGGECAINGSLLNLLLSSLTLRWKLPAGYSVADAQISYTGSAGLVPVTDTLTGTNLKTTVAGDTYTTVLTGGLLGAALGATRVLSVQVVHPSGWISQPRTVTGVWPTLGIGTATCSMTPAT